MAVFAEKFDTRHAIDSGHVDEDASTVVDGGHGSDHLHGLDLVRLPTWAGL